VDAPDSDKIERNKLEFPHGFRQPTWSYKYSRQFAFSNDRCPEKWIKFLLFDVLQWYWEPDDTLKLPDKKSMFQFFEGSYLVLLLALSEEEVQAEDSEISDNDLIE
jgi:hypothetical protein